MHSSNGLLLIAAKVVDDILIAAPLPITKRLVEHIRSQFKLGTIVYGATCFDFYSIKIDQESDMSVTVSSENRLHEMKEFTIDRTRRKQSSESLNEIEKAH